MENFLKWSFILYVKSLGKRKVFLFVSSLLIKMHVIWSSVNWWCIRKLCYLVHCACLYLLSGTLINHHKGDFNGLFEENKEYLFQKVRGKIGWWVSKSNIKASIRGLLERHFPFPMSYWGISKVEQKTQMKSSYRLKNWIFTDLKKARGESYYLLSIYFYEIS